MMFCWVKKLNFKTIIKDYWTKMLNYQTKK